ncbi:hypothetical protein ACETK8_03325 [Brevundimonas staleyi]|uniref:Right-handed parallel beta-helix repeat-containing protein n=1 Tax=Brevundimonas staleyi TaxID=74326 RepID=A0ABW0FUH2_9CAUL
MSRLPLTRAVRVAPDLRTTVFEDVDLNLFDLHVANHGHHLGVIMGRTFRGCRIQGPAIMLVSAGVRFDDCSFGDPNGDMRNLVLRPTGDRALGTVPFRDTLFEGCEFYNVGFTGSEQVVSDLLAVGA